MPAFLRAPKRTDFVTTVEQATELFLTVIVTLGVFTWLIIAYLPGRIEYVTIFQVVISCIALWSTGLAYGLQRNISEGRGLKLRTSGTFARVVFGQWRWLGAVPLVALTYWTFNIIPESRSGDSGCPLVKLSQTFLPLPKRWPYLDISDESLSSGIGTQWREISGESEKDLKRRLRFFDRVDLSGRDLRCMRATRAQLIKAKLDKADLRNTNLIGARLDGAELTDAWLQNAVISNAWFYRARLTNADMRYVKARNTVFRRVEGDSALLCWADARDADFRDGQFRGADFFKANLEGANFQAAELASANLRGAELRFANFTKANLERTDLRKTDLSNAPLDSLSRDQIARACIDNSTQLPIFLDRPEPAQVARNCDELDERFPEHAPNHVRYKSNGICSPQ